MSLATSNRMEQQAADEALRCAEFLPEMCLIPLMTCKPLVQYLMQRD